MARMQSMSRTRQRLDEKDPKWPLKVVLRVAATVFAFVGAVLFILVISKTLHLDNPYFESGDGDMTDEIPLAPVIVAPTSMFLGNSVTMKH